MLKITRRAEAQSETSENNDRPTKQPRRQKQKSLLGQEGICKGPEVGKLGE